MSRVAFVLAVALTGLAPTPSNANPQDPPPQVSAKVVPTEEATPPVTTPAAGSEQSDPETQGFLKRKFKSFLTDDDSSTGRGFHVGPFAPRLEIVSTGSGPGPILHLWASDIGGTPLDIHASASYSIYKYQYYDFQFGLLPHKGGQMPRVERGTNGLFPLSDIEKNALAPGFNMYVSARYRDYPREDFFGIGPNTLMSNHTGYRLQDGLYEGVMRFRVGQFSMMGRAGILQTTILPGGDSAVADAQLSYNDTTAPGLFTSPDFVHMSVGAWLERRDEPFNAHRGVAIGASFSRFDDRHGDSYNFNRATLDAREYLPLGSNRHVIALRQIVSLDDPDAGSAVPFYMQTILGGSATLRGYGSFRFRDDKVMNLAAEYRFEARPKVELALFYEAGKVFSDRSDLSFKNLLGSYGVGIRLKSPKRVKLRIDVLRSAEATRLHLKLGPSF